MSGGAAGGAFWSWSLAFYDRPGVPAACIGLQDRCGVDVNLLLLGLWLAARGLRLNSAAAARIAARAEGWQSEVVAPLRSVRRRLRQGLGALDGGAEALVELRRQIAAAELEAERLEQQELERLAASGRGAAPATSATAAANWRALRVAPLEPGPARALLSEAFPSEPPAERDPALAFCLKSEPERL